MNNDDLDLGSTLRGFSSGQSLFGRYALKKMLGQGGMGVVWLAHDETLNRDVALKFLPEVVALDARAVDDMKRETRRSLELTHPNIVRIYDFVEDKRNAAISMEYVDGSSLSKRALDNPDRVFPIAEVERLIRNLCEVLDYAHSRAKIIHRDLKPANLMLTQDGELKVADFGISATLSDSTSRASNNAASTSGTPVYMSPQQMMGEKPTPTDDIYSLGATVYELLTGKPPFYSGNIIVQVQNKVPPSMTERRDELGLSLKEPIPQAWEKMVAACLAKNAEERPQSANEVLAMLDGQKLPKHAAVGHSSPGVAGKPGRARWIPYVAAGSVLLIAATCAGWWYGIHRPELQIRAERERIARVEEEKRAEAIRALTESSQQAAHEAAERLAQEKAAQDKASKEKGKAEDAAKLETYLNEADLRRAVESAKQGLFSTSIKELERLSEIPACAPEAKAALSDARNTMSKADLVVAALPTQISDGRYKDASIALQFLSNLGDYKQIYNENSIKIGNLKRSADDDLTSARADAQKGSYKRAQSTSAKLAALADYSVYAEQVKGDAVKADADAVALMKKADAMIGAGRYKESLDTLALLNNVPDYAETSSKLAGKAVARQADAEGMVKSIDQYTKAQDYPNAIAVTTALMKIADYEAIASARMTEIRRLVDSIRGTLEVQRTSYIGVNKALYSMVTLGDEYWYVLKIDGKEVCRLDKVTRIDLKPGTYSVSIVVRSFGESNEGNEKPITSSKVTIIANKVSELTFH